MKTGVQWAINVWKKLAKPVSAHYRDLFGGADLRGNRILEDLRHYCNDVNSSFVPGDVYQTVFNEGMRAVLLHIREMASLTEKDFPLDMESTRG